MSSENKKTKPNCPLVGQDGNIFNLVGIASRVLKRNGMLCISYLVFFAQWLTNSCSISAKK